MFSMNSAFTPRPRTCSISLRHIGRRGLAVGADPLGREEVTP